MEASTLVIKVKYGDTLRRFNAMVVDKELNLNMSELTEKIFSLFNFAPDTGIILTYIDEDGDLVSLVDDDDLRDVVKQSLNPLRITVKMNTEKNGVAFTNSTGTSSSRSPRVQLPFQNSNSIAPEILKTIPEPLRETLVKLSTDLASKVSSSAPGISPGVTELVNYFSKVGLSYLNQLSESQTRVGPSTQSDIPESSIDAPETNDLDLSKVSSSDRSEKQSSKKNEISAKLKPEAVTKDIEVKFGSATGGSLEASSSKAYGINAVDSSLNSKTIIVGLNKNDYLHYSEPRYSKPMVLPASVGEKEKAKMIDECNDKSHQSLSCSIGASKSDNVPENSTDTVLVSSSGTPQPTSRAVSLNRSRSQNDGSGTIFHRGVRCDGCGVLPITGPRFKSKVKVDYDLCSICFPKLGSDKDYIRIDHPSTYPHHWSIKGFHEYHARGRCPAFQQVSRGSKIKPDAFKLDSRFIQDVNILDGTIIAPLTPFTKIWRMKNNGTVMWPQRTQLVWIGGDKMSSAFSVEVKVPTAGLAVDQELDVAVDFISPELPGRYVSYWRMALPSGQKFGQRVWVLIQVDAAFKETQDGVGGLNLNLPLVNSVLTGPEIINMDLAPLAEDSRPEPEIVDPVVHGQQPNIEQEMKFPITDSLLIESSAASSAPLAPPSSFYPFVDLSDVASPAFFSPSAFYPLPPPPSLNPLPPPPILNPLPLPSSLSPLALPSSFNPPPTPIGNAHAYTDLQGKEEVEKKLLKELEEMGFKQVDLNKEILRMHEYDLEQAVDNLCEVAEWNPILEELQEMGFNDTEMNKELLKKNNGSIKRVIMDLIAREEM